MPHTLADHFTHAIDALCATADAYLLAARLDDALGVLAHAEQLAQMPDAPSSTHVRVLLRQGYALTRQASFATNEYATPVAILTRAEAIARSLGDDLLLAGALYGLARALYGRAMTTGEGSFDEVEHLIRVAATLYEQRHDQAGMMDTQLYLGYIAERQNRFDHARSIFEAVRDQARQHGLTDALAEAERHLGFAHWRAEEPVAALVCFQRSLAILEAQGNHLVLPFAHLSVAETYQMLKLWADARGHYDAALALAETAGIHRAAVQTLYSIGEWHVAQGEQGPARPYYERALAQAQAIGFTRGIAMIQAKLAAQTD